MSYKGSIWCHAGVRSCQVYVALQFDSEAKCLFFFFLKGAIFSSFFWCLLPIPATTTEDCSFVDKIVSSHGLDDWRVLLALFLKGQKKHILIIRCPVKHSAMNSRQLIKLADYHPILQVGKCIWKGEGLVLEKDLCTVLLGATVSNLSGRNLWVTPQNTLNLCMRCLWLGATRPNHMS